MFFICLVHTATAGELKIITSGGFQGVADADGKVIVPAIYEKLGWSSGEHEIVNQNIGFYENGKWGLINIKTKKIQGAKFQVLEPFNETYFEAGKNVPYSNVLKRGLIDEMGKVILDFHYYTISDLGGDLFGVAKYEVGILSFGVYSATNKVIVPCQYVSIDQEGDLLVASNNEKKLRVYDRNGVLLISDWIDQISTIDGGYAVAKAGYFGKLDEKGRQLLDIGFKEVYPVKSEFRKWEVKTLTDRDKPGVFVSCDSITYQTSGDMLIAHVNQAEHLLAAGDMLFNDAQNTLKHIGNGFIVTKNTALQTWAIHKTDGREVISGYDSIAVDSMYFYTLSREGWDIYNLFGRKINEFSFQGVGFSQNRNVPVKRNDYWGWINFQGEELIDYRYEKVVPTGHYKHFLAKNYKRWGVNTTDDEWVILPEYDSLYAFDDFYIATKMSASYVFNRSGKLLQSIPYEVKLSGYLQLRDGGKVGAVTSQGYYIHPLYDDIAIHGEFYEMSKGDTVIMIYKDGRPVLGYNDGVSDVLSFSEGYFHIIKDGKHGFVDVNGKLRVANRYDSAQFYSEGLAPVKLLDKWGFIDKYEILTIQPFYRYSSVFKNGLAIIQSGEKYGIITPTGDEIVSVDWKNIERLPTGNYRITDWDNKVGLVNATGRFVLRPNYDRLEDTEKSLIIGSKNGKKGVINYDGYTKVPFQYSDIQIQGDYLLLLKEETTLGNN